MPYITSVLNDSMHNVIITRIAYEELYFTPCQVSCKVLFGITNFWTQLLHIHVKYQYLAFERMRDSIEVFVLCIYKSKCTVIFQICKEF